MAKIISNDCPMSSLNVDIFEKNFNIEEDSLIFHPCGLVKSDFAEKENFKKYKKVYVIGCIKDDFKDYDNVEIITTEKLHEIVKKGMFFGNKVRIGYGCNHKCSFCPTKLLRPSNGSRIIKNIIEDIEKIEDNCKDKEFTIYLSADDCSSYYSSQKEDLIILLERVKKEFPNIVVKLGYLYPKYVLDNLDFFVKNKNWININMPIISGSDRILRITNRGDYNNDDIKKIINSLDIETYFIFGYPTETFNEFMETFKISKNVKRSVFFLYNSYNGTKSFYQYGNKKSNAIEKMKKHLANNNIKYIDWDSKNPSYK
jgi:tRNA A37 methylthiotransferase MiaB